MKIEDMFDISKHVRYVFAFTRATKSGERYTAMKINVEVGDANDEAKVRDTLTRAMRRELPHDDKLGSLTETVVTLAWRWLQCLRLGTQITTMEENGVLFCSADRVLLLDKQDALHASIFTKEDKARVDGLFAKS